MGPTPCLWSENSPRVFPEARAGPWTPTVPTLEGNTSRLSPPKGTRVRVIPEARAESWTPTVSTPSGELPATRALPHEPMP